MLSLVKTGTVEIDALVLAKALSNCPPGNEPWCLKTQAWGLLPVLHLDHCSAA